MAIAEDYEYIVNKNEKHLSNSKGFAKRYIQLICLIFTGIVLFLTKVQMGVTIVAMTDTGTSNKHDNIFKSSDLLNETINNNRNIDIITNISQQIQLSNAKERTKVYLVQDPNDAPYSVFKTYNWSSTIQSSITTSFFVGYTIMLVPSSELCQRFGSKSLLLLCSLVNGVLPIITPWAALLGWWAVFLSRTLQGMAQAVVLPAISHMVANWAPYSERNMFITTIFTCIPVGTVIGYQMAGILAASTLGWPSTFWISGAMGLACFLMLWNLGVSTPEDHPTISLTELKLIKADTNECRSDSRKKKTTPWRAMFSSGAIWAFIFTHVGSSFCFNFSIVNMPLYMKYILDVDIRQNGLLLSLPYFVLMIALPIVGRIGDCLISRRIFSVKTVRRIGNSIGEMGYAVAMFALTYAETLWLAEMLLVIMVFNFSFTQVGYVANQFDLTPNFAGTLIAVCSVLANLLILTTPAIVSFVLTDLTDVSQWRLVFGVMALIKIIANVVFVIFVQTDVQPWDSQESSACEKTTTVYGVSENEEEIPMNVPEET